MFYRRTKVFWKNYFNKAVKKTLLIYTKRAIVSLTINDSVFMSDLDWERIGLMLLFIGFSVYGWFEVNRAMKREQRPTHRYNRDTGKVERNKE